MMVVTHLLVGLVLAQTCSGGVCAGTAVQPVAAAHYGQYSAGQIGWRSVYVVEDRELSPLHTTRIPLAFPIPAAALVVAEEDTGVVPVQRGDGAVVALDVQPNAWSAADRVRRMRVRRVSVETRQPVGGAGPAVLRPPLAQSEGAQKVVLARNSDLQFEADPALRVMRHTTHLAAEEVSHVMRNRCERLLDDGASASDPRSIYVVANEAIAAHQGLAGALVSRTAHRHTVGLAVAGSGVVLVAVLIAGYVRLSRRAERDRRRQLVNAELSRLDQELQQIDGTLSRLEPGSEGSST